MNYSQLIGCSERYVGEGTAVVFDLLLLEKLSLQLVNMGRKVFSRLILPLIHLLNPFTGRELSHFIHAHVCYAWHMLALSLRSILTQVIKFKTLFLWFPVPPTAHKQNKHGDWLLSKQNDFYVINFFQSYYRNREIGLDA